MKAPKCTNELGRLYFEDYEEPQKICVSEKQHDQSELWDYSSVAI